MVAVSRMKPLIFLMVCVVFMVAIQASMATTTTNECFSPSNGFYTVYSHTGYDWDNANQATLNAIASAEVVSPGTGVLYSVGCDLLKSYGIPWSSGYANADQTLSLDLRPYQATNGYTKAWFQWVCHYSPGPISGQPLGIWSGTPITNHFPLSLGAEQSAGLSFHNIPPPIPMQLNGWGGWGCKYPGEQSTWPWVYLERQIADVQPKKPNNPGCQKLSNVGDPMNVMNGDMSLSETDLVIPAPGIPLEFRRWYGSVSTATGLMGPKWTCSGDLSAWTTNTVFGGLTNKWLVFRMGENDEWRPLTVTNGAVAISHGPRWTGSLDTNGTCHVVLSAGLTCRFDTNGALERVEEPFGNVVTFTRTNLAGTILLTGMEHSNGQYLHFEYTSNLLTRVLAPSTNLSARYTYNADGDLTNSTLTVSNRDYATSYAYIAGTHVLTQRVNAAGTVRAWAYDGVKATNSVVGDNRWYETTLTHSTNGTPQTTVCFARGDTNITYLYEFDPLLNKIDGIYGPNTSNSANWAGTRYSHDELGNFTQVEDADWRPGVLAWSKRAMKYDGQSRLTNSAFGYLVEPTNPYSLGWNTNWDTLAWAVDPEGHRAEWDYTNGVVSVARIFPATNQVAETFYSYTSNGLLAAVTNANGHWMAVQYDALGFPACGVSQSGLTNWMTWDSLGHLNEIRLPNGDYDTNEPPQMIPRTLTFDPDELGRVRRIAYPDSSFETFAFDAIGNLTNHVDVAGRTNLYSWLPTRKLAAVTRYLTAGGSNQAATIQASYDKQFNALTIQDELGRAVESYRLDLQDRPISVTNVENQGMSIVWGLKDMVKQIVRFDGTTINIAYESGGRVSQVSYPDDTVSFRYLKNDLPLTVSNCWGVISNAYDGANRQILSQASGLIPQPVSVNYGYYPAGQVSNVVSVAGTTVYGFDAGERLQSLATIAANSNQDSFGYSYDPINGQLSSAAYSNGLSCAYGYDILDRLTGITWRNVSNQVLRSRTYSYTAAGMIARMDTEDGGHVDYSYDSLDRLTREKHVDVYGQVASDEKYEFDLAGNRTKKTVLDSIGNPLVTVGYTLGTGNRLASWTVSETNLMACFPVAGYASETIGANDRFGALWVSNAAPGGMSVKPVLSGTNFLVDQMVVGMGTQTIVAAIRDVAGNTTYATNTVIPTVVTNGAYLYNSAGCLTNIQYKGKDYSQSLGLTWDGQYQLTAATTNGAVAERYGYDATGRRLWIWDGTAGTNWFAYDGNQVIADLNSTGELARSYVWGPGIDNLLSMTVYGGTTNTYYALKDHLGSVLALTDNAGNIVESYRYDAWGRTTVYGANGSALTASAVGNRYCWQGREYFWKTGLYYFRARWADPVTGRWLSPDPIGIAGGLNMYAMMGNNPVNFADPQGTDIYFSSGGGKHASIIVDIPNCSGGHMAYDFAPAQGGKKDLDLNVFYGPSKTDLEPWPRKVPSTYIHIPATSEQDLRAIILMKLAKTEGLPYAVGLNNCANMARMVIDGAGIPIGDGFWGSFFDTPSRLENDIQRYLDRKNDNTNKDCK